MTRALRTTCRPMAVWLAVSGATLLAASSLPGAWRTAAGPAGPGAVADVLVAGCAVALTVALAWLWVVTSVTAAEMVTGRIRPGGGTTRRLVLLACGAAVVAGAGAPAVAADAGDGAELLAGLALPERAVAPAVHRVRSAPAASATTRGAGTYVVRPGDSLWSIARTHPAGDSIDERWRAIWTANRDVVGADPDLIHPGQALRLPVPHTDPHTEKDGDRS